MKMSNKTYNTMKYVAQIARSACRGLCDYFGIPFVEPRPCQ